LRAFSADEDEEVAPSFRRLLRWRWRRRRSLPEVEEDESEEDPVLSV
jgi:hypothetical protein